MAELVSKLSSVFNQSQQIEESSSVLLDERENGSLKYGGFGERWFVAWSLGGRFLHTFYQIL